MATWEVPVDPQAMSTQYTGPRPSPARRWAPVLEYVLGAAVLGNVLELALNLVERHNLERARALQPVSRVFADDTLSTIRALNRIVLGVLIVLIVVDIVWLNRRRAPTRLREVGEAGVEPALAVVSRKLYGAFWAAIALSFVAYELARSSTHVGMSVDDFITYRTWTAIAAALRATAWGLYCALVVAATRRQERREAGSTAPAPVPPGPPAPFTV